MEYGPLVADAQQPKGQTEELRRKGGLVVGSERRWPTEAIDQVEYHAKHGDGGLAIELLKRKAGASAVIDHAEEGA